MNGATGNSPQTGGGEVVPYVGPTPSGNGLMVRAGPMTIITFKSSGHYNTYFPCPDYGQSIHVEQGVASTPNTAWSPPSPLSHPREFAAWVQGQTARAREMSQAFYAGTPWTPR